MHLLMLVQGLNARFLAGLCQVDFVAPLLLRLYLVPIFWMAGISKLADIESTAAWFGNPDWGLGLPAPTLLAWVAGMTEAGGALLLLLGLAVRWVALPLSFTMIVAALTVHWENGWLAIAEGSHSVFATERTVEAVLRLERARALLQEHGNYSWLTEHGSLVVLNNGIEFAATYLVMLLALLVLGAGRWVSADYWLSRLPMGNSSDRQRA